MKTIIRKIFYLILAVISANTYALVETTHYNLIRPLKTGYELTQARQTLIKEAEEFIYIKAYTFNTDPSDYPIFDLLCMRSLNGIDVRILVDYFGGSFSGPSSIKTSGGRYSVDWFRNQCHINFQFYSPLNPIYRQHEKMIVTDKMVITGGTNFSKEYSLHGRYSHLWYDFDSEIKGPAVCTYHKIFNQSWAYASSLILSDTALYKNETLNSNCKKNVPIGGANIKVLYNNPIYGDQKPYDVFFKKSIDKVATKYGSEGIIRIYSPYLILTNELKKSIIEAKTKGVKIKIITNSSTSIDDQPDVYTAMLLNSKELLENGIEIYLWNPSKKDPELFNNDNVFHKKGGCFNSEVCYFGSYNFDIRGEHLSSELISITDDTAFVNDYISEFDQDLSLSQRLNLTLQKKLISESDLKDYFRAITTDWLM